MFCALCGQRLSASLMRYGLTYWCPEGPGAHVRIRGADTERYLLEGTADHLRADPSADTEADPVLRALRAQLHDLQDDHYDRLLDRPGFLRQTRRLQQRIANRRRELTFAAGARPVVSVGVTPAVPEPVRRAVLRQHLARVEVRAHPAGTSTRPPAARPDWAAGIARRLQVQWHSDILRVEEPERGEPSPSHGHRPAPATAPVGELLAASSRWN